MNKKQILENKIYAYLYRTAEANSCSIDELFILLAIREKKLHISVHRGATWFETGLEEILSLSALERLIENETSIAAKITKALYELNEKYSSTVEIRIHWEQRFFYRAYCKLAKVEELDIEKLIAADEPGK